ncbi:hypothetical protein ACS0TY_026105 [Phlomoides rotata]
MLHFGTHNRDSDTRVILLVENIPPPNAEWFDSIWNHDGWLRSGMCLESIHGFGHSKERTPSMFADGTDLEHSPQFVLLHQRPHKKAFSYIKKQETKPTLVVNLTEDEISTRRAWGVWVYLTEMYKIKYPFKIYQNSVNESFLLNSMTGSTTRFVNDTFE